MLVTPTDCLLKEGDYYPMQTKFFLQKVTMMYRILKIV